jgi:hypothetical protein
MAFNKKLDPRVAAMLPNIYTAEQLQAAKDIVAGEANVVRFKKSMAPEKKEVPQAFINQHKAKAKTNVGAKAKSKVKRVLKGAANEVFAFMAINIDAGLNRQQSIAAAVDKFGVTKHSAGYHFDKAVGKR